MHFKSILVFEPHMDGGELRCGGSIARFIKGERKFFMWRFLQKEELFYE